MFDAFLFAVNILRMHCVLKELFCILLEIMTDKLIMLLQALKTIKGVLNKLTPDNFDRLVKQIVVLVTSADTLRKTISLVFEKAVAEPTFCALYASLCEVLSNELPDFPPLEGEMKPLTFRRILLNTCQDEFEGVGEARAVRATSKPLSLASL